MKEPKIISNQTEKKNSYTWLFLFELCIIFICTIVFATIWKKGDNASEPNLLLLLIGVSAIVHGFVSYAKYHSVWKLHLIYIASWILFSFSLWFLTGGNELSFGLGIFLCLVSLSLSLFTSFITMLISKAKKYFQKRREVSSEK